MYIKYGGNWVEPQDFYVKDGETWKRPTSIYVKMNGAWVEKQLVPSNVVMLYENMPPTGYLCNGSNSTPNLLNKALAGHTTALQLGGNDSHNGSDHGTLGFSIAGAEAYSNAGGSSESERSRYYVTSRNLHSHSYSAVWWDSFDRKWHGHGLLPIKGTTFIHTGCIILSNKTISLSNLILYAIVAGFIYLRNTSVEVGSNPGGHFGSGTTSTNRVNTNPYSKHMHGAQPDDHSHQIYYTAAHNTPPRYKALYPYRVQNNMAFNELPSGAIIFTVDNTLPTGFSWYDVGSEPTLLHAETSPNTAGVYGSSTHNHSGETSAWTGGGIYTNPDVYGVFGDVPNTFTTQYLSSHTHGVSITVGSANNMPAYVTLRIAVKN